MNVFSLLQSAIQKIYLLDELEPVDRFMIDSSLLHQLLPSAPINRDEQLLICQDQADECFVGLYLDPRLVLAGRATDLSQQLSQLSLDDLSALIEGISHFVYCQWAALQQRQTSLLELEIQAEIDKFIANYFLRQGHHEPVDLLSRLYDAYSFIDGLSRAETERYRTAHQLGKRFSYHLATTYLQVGEFPALLNLLRRFYRLDQADKISTIIRMS